MRLQLQIKLLEHLNKKKTEQGFTLVELLIVIVIIGILAAVGLPSFLSQSAKAKQSEGKQYTSTVNRVQIAFRTNKTSFASDFDTLAIGSLTNAKSSTAAYNYTITGGTDSGTIIATSKDPAIRGYGGALKRSNTGNDSESSTASIICENNVAGIGAPTIIIGAFLPSCAAGSTDLSIK